MNNREQIVFDNDGLDTVVAISTFLSENCDTLIEKFQLDAKKFLANQDMFEGIFKKAYLEAFDGFILRLIQEAIVDHFIEYTPEQIVMVCEKQVISLISTDEFFNLERYQ